MSSQIASKDALRKCLCVRYHKSGEKAVEPREPEVVNAWLRFNTDFRPDAALFVDGECRRQGAFTADECATFAAALQAPAQQVVQQVCQSSLDFAE